MARRSRYKSNPKGLEEVARSYGVQKLVHKYGDDYARRAGSGYEASYMQGTGRYRGLVGPSTWSARRDNEKNNTLLRVLG